MKPDLRTRVDALISNPAVIDYAQALERELPRAVCTAVIALASLAVASLWLYETLAPLYLALPILAILAFDELKSSALGLDEPQDLSELAEFHGITHAQAIRVRCGATVVAVLAACGVAGLLTLLLGLLGTVLPVGFEDGEFDVYNAATNPLANLSAALLCIDGAAMLLLGGGKLAYVCDMLLTVPVNCACVALGYLAQNEGPLPALANGALEVLRTPPVQLGSFALAICAVALLALGVPRLLAWRDARAEKAKGTDSAD